MEEQLNYSKIQTKICLFWMFQGLPQGGSLYVLGGQADSQPVMAGLLSRIQLAPMAQAGSATQAFSSVFTDRRSSLFDSAISSW